MRRASNAVVLADEAEPESAPAEDIALYSTESDDDRNGAVAAVVRDAQRLIDALSHDLRQPLSSINMNVASAIRCLQLPEPRVASALEALTECLAPESEMLAMVADVQRHLSITLAEAHRRPLDGRAPQRDARVIAVQGAEARQIASPHGEGSLRVTSALRAALVAIARSILALARRNWNGPARDAPNVRIETRRISGPAQLRLCGFRCESAQDMAFLRHCAETAARYLAAQISLELGPTAAAIVISFPTGMTARRPVYVRGNHGA